MCHKDNNDKVIKGKSNLRNNVTKVYRIDFMAFNSS